jgi:hypothetical protein
MFALFVAASTLRLAAQGLVPRAYVRLASHFPLASTLLANFPGEIEMEGNPDKVVLMVGSCSRVVLMFVVGIELNAFADGK